MTGCSGHGKIRQYFTDDRLELEAMSAESGGDDDLFMFGMLINDEMSIFGVGVQTDTHVLHWSTGLGHESAEMREEVRFISGLWRSIEGCRITGFRGPVSSHLESGWAMSVGSHWKSVQQ